MHVIKVTHEQFGFGAAVGCRDPQYYGPFPEVGAAVQVFQGKLWTRVDGGENKNHWTANQSATRLIHAEIVLLTEIQEEECMDPYDLPCGGVYYN